MVVEIATIILSRLFLGVDLAETYAAESLGVDEVDEEDVAVAEDV